MRKPKFQRGKAFYTQLSLLLVFACVPVLITLPLAQKILHDCDQQQRSLLLASFGSQLHTIQECSSGSESSNPPEALLQQNFFPTPEAKASSTTDGVSPTALLRVTAWNLETVGRLDPDRDPASDALRRLAGTAGIPSGLFLPDSDGYSAAQLQNALTSSLREPELCLYDPSGSMLVSLGSGELSGQYTYDTLGPETDGFFSFPSGGNTYLCCYTYDSDRQTKLALFCRDDGVEGLRRLSVGLWLTGGGILLLSLLCALVCVRQTYRPVRSLMARLQPDHKPGSRPLDEYAALEQALADYQGQLDRSNRILEEYNLLRLLHGKPPEMPDLTSDSWLVQDKPHLYAVAVLRMEPGQALPEEAALNREISVCLQDSSAQARVISDGDCFDLLFRVDPDFTAEQLLETCRNLQARLSRYPFSLFVSSLCNAPEDLHQGYTEAALAAEYYDSNDPNGIVAGADSVPFWYRQVHSGTPDLLLLKQLSDCVACADPGEAMQSFDRLTERLLRDSTRPKKAKDPALILLADCLSLALYDAGLIGRAEVTGYMDQFRRGKTLEDVRSILDRTLQNLRRVPDRADDPRIAAIREYILQNYTDPNLDAATIAEAYQISLSTLTRLFKKYNGTGFLEYVHHLRVEHAITLLKTTNLTVSQIAEQVGYTNPATMNRAFKAHANCTPGMIRRTGHLPS